MILTQNLVIACIFSISLSFILLYFFNKNNLLLDQISSSKHKQLTKVGSPNKVSVCGGIIIYLCCILFFGNELFYLKCFATFILTIGILSDINKLNSPKVRIICQFLSVLFLLLFDTNLALTDLRVNFINNILETKIFSLLFTIFCILILINGTNFLDGINTLVVGYYLLVLMTVIFTATHFNLYFNLNIFYLMIFLCIAFFFNFFNKIYLGDSGSYLISFFISFFILDFVSMNNLISPYFICLLLWYPAFENLFSILRRTFKKTKLDQADQDHLHQMIFKVLYNKLFFNNKYLNTIVGILINLYNLIIFSISYKYYLNTKYLIFFIFINICVYLLLYFFMKKKLNHLN